MTEGHVGACHWWLECCLWTEKGEGGGGGRGGEGDTGNRSEEENTCQRAQVLGMSSGKSELHGLLEAARVPERQDGVNGGWGIRGTHRSLGQGECQVLQVVLMAQGPRREGGEVWSGHGSHTSQEIVLESRGSQYSGQLRKSKCVRIWKVTSMPSGAPRLPVPCQTQK